MKCANCKKKIKQGTIYYRKNNKGKSYCINCDFGGKGHIRVIKKNDK